MSVSTVEELSNKKKTEIDQRVQDMFAWLLFCTKKVNYMEATILGYLACQLNCTKGHSILCPHQQEMR